MKFNALKTINEQELLRLTGIKSMTFDKILKILQEAELKKFLS